MSDETVLKRKRLIFKEDIDFDISGDNEKVTIEGNNGVAFNASKVNARHIPVTKRLRNLLNVSNVDDALSVLSGGNGLSSDVSIDVGKLPTATEISNGVARLATKKEVMTGVSDNTIVTPRRLHELKASSTQLGIVELATSEDLRTFSRPNAVVTTSVLGGIGFSSMPIGAGPIPWYWGSAPEGWLLANGGIYSRDEYPEFWKLIENYVIDDSQWNDNMACFSNGTGGRNFRMPNLTVSNMGDYAGLKPTNVTVSFIFKGK